MVGACVGGGACWCGLGLVLVGCGKVRWRILLWRGVLVVVMLVMCLRAGPPRVAVAQGSCLWAGPRLVAVVGVCGAVHFRVLFHSVGLVPLSRAPVASVYGPVVSRENCHAKIQRQPGRKPLPCGRGGGFTSVASFGGRVVWAGLTAWRCGAVAWFEMVWVNAVLGVVPPGLAAVCTLVG